MDGWGGCWLGGLGLGIFSPKKLTTEAGTPQKFVVVFFGSMEISFGKGGKLQVPALFVETGV